MEKSNSTSDPSMGFDEEIIPPGSDGKLTSGFISGGGLGQPVCLPELKPSTSRVRDLLMEDRVELTDSNLSLN